jgi:hypothetical protein
MRMTAATIGALGIVGSIAIAAPSPASAQGVYLQGPGVGITIGRPYYRERYHRYYDDGAYAYSPRYQSRQFYVERPYRYERRIHRRGGWDWD